MPSTIRPLNYITPPGPVARKRLSKFCVFAVLVSIASCPIIPEVLITDADERLVLNRCGPEGAEVLVFLQSYAFPIALGIASAACLYAAIRRRDRRGLALAWQPWESHCCGWSHWWCFQ